MNEFERLVRSLAGHLQELAEEGVVITSSDLPYRLAKRLRENGVVVVVYDD